LQRDEPEQTDQQRQPELGAAKADHAAEQADGRGREERQDGGLAPPPPAGLSRRLDVPRR
jgi:hypothetical protein